MERKIKETMQFYANRLIKHIEICRLLEQYPNLPADSVSVEYSSTTDLLLHITLLNIDIDIACKYFLIGMLQNNKAETAYFGRAVALHCINAIDGGGDCIPARVNSLSKRLHSFPQLQTTLAELGTAKRDLGNLRQHYITYLKNIRNSLYAHRTGNGIEQNLAIENIDGNRLGLVVIDVLDKVEAITNALLKILQGFDNVRAV